MDRPLACCSADPTKIGILQCGAVPPELAAAHGPYGVMMQRLVPQGAQLVLHDVASGAFPSSATEADAWVLTGSPAGVYDDLP